MKNFLSRRFCVLAEKYAPEQEGEIIGDYSDILINDLEERFGTLDYFRFFDATRLRNYLKETYLHVNQESLDYAVSKILMRYSGDVFRKYKTEQEKEDFVEIVLQYYDNNDTQTAKYIREHMIHDDTMP